jgi:chemotaxis-related protein WspB
MTLLLQFQMGADRYVIDTAEVVRVLPLVAIKHIPQAPRGVAGAFDFQGAPVPVIDLSELALGRPAQRCLSTRIVLVNYRDRVGRARRLGLLAEKATQTVRRRRSEFVSSGVHCEAAPYLGPVACDSDGLVQWIEVRKLLPDSVREALFAQVEEVA